MVAVERCIEFSKLKQEGPFFNDKNQPPSSWPSNGVIEFKNLKMRYREGLDLVLRGLTFKIQSKEKVGIVGRTGAGKSSLMLALFRICEFAEGTILIDDVDISKIGLNDLRTKISIIPQDPLLFTGTLRTNLDPFGQCSDFEIWNALESCHMKQTIENLTDKLEERVLENGENYSVGQRQLICMARAILKKSKIILFDEATASVDFDSDEVIQKTIRTEFKNTTVLTIAHRINTILDYDKILVLENGKIAEFDTPNNLLSNHQGLFYSLVRSSLNKSTS